MIIPGPRNILWIPASAADATVINPSCINIVLANDWSKFFINNRAILINDPRSLPTNRPDCIILKSSVSNNFMLLDEFFTKALQRLATCSLVINNLWGNYFDCHESYLMIILMSPPAVAFFVADFNLFSFEADNFTFTILDWVIL